MPQKMTNAFAAKLQSGETIEAAIKATLVGDTLPGALILTNRRIAFFRKGMIGEKFEAIDLSKVSSIEGKSTLGFHYVTVHTSGNAIKIQAWGPTTAFLAKAEDVRARETSVPASSSPSLADTLRQLSTLHDEGVLSDAEFETKKADVLARM